MTSSNNNNTYTVDNIRDSEHYILSGRISRNPVVFPENITLNFDQDQFKLVVTNTKTNKSLELDVAKNLAVTIDQESKSAYFLAKDQSAKAISGTVSALVKNMVRGLSVGHEKRLNLIGVGYKAQVQGNVINLMLGFSHPVKKDIPEGLDVTVEGNTNVIIKGCDKQLVGQFSAEIRQVRPPEPYKGKGVRYHDEHVKLKDGKKTK